MLSIASYPSSFEYARCGSAALFFPELVYRFTKKFMCKKMMNDIEKAYEDRSLSNIDATTGLVALTPRAYVTWSTPALTGNLDD
jgi:hypothetical protein